MISGLRLTAVTCKTCSFRKCFFYILCLTFRKCGTGENTAPKCFHFRLAGDTEESYFLETFTNTGNSLVKSRKRKRCITGNSLCFFSVKVIADDLNCMRKIERCEIFAGWNCDTKGAFSHFFIGETCSFVSEHSCYHAAVRVCRTCNFGCFYGEFFRKQKFSFAVFSATACCSCRKCAICCSSGDRAIKFNVFPDTACMNGEDMNFVIVIVFTTAYDAHIIYVIISHGTAGSTYITAFLRAYKNNTNFFYVHVASIVVFRNMRYILYIIYWKYKVYQIYLTWDRIKPINIISVGL